MDYDEFGQPYTSTEEICDLLYRNPELDLSKFVVTDAAAFNRSVSRLYADMPQLRQYAAYQLLDPEFTLADFDAQNQSNWYMPDEYKTLDIAEWVLNQCRTQAELQRVGEELMLFQERGLFTLLQYLKYMVDTLKANNVVIGVGRGSSTASYVLFLIGVHRINSMYYDLDIGEFLKPDPVQA
mgnify:CR=1 FL=1